MKLSLGRGIKFFKKPIFSAPKSFVVNTFGAGKKRMTAAFSSVGKTFTKKKKGK